MGRYFTPATIWEATAAAVTLGSGSHHWFTTAGGVGTFTTDATNVPAAAWLPIPVPTGARGCVVEWHGKIVTSAAGTCTGLTGRVGCVAMRDFDVAEDLISKPAIVRLGTAPIADAVTRGIAMAVPVWSKTIVSPAGLFEDSLFQSGMPDTWPIIPDSTTIAANDYTDGRLVIGHATQFGGGTLVSGPRLPSVDGFEQLYLAIKIIPTLGAGGAITVAGSLRAYFTENPT